MGTTIPPGFIVGLVRNDRVKTKSHLYEGTFAEPGNPMCQYGWNRDAGTSYSIWRGNVGPLGICRICLKRARAGEPSIEAARLEHGPE